MRKLFLFAIPLAVSVGVTLCVPKPRPQVQGTRSHSIHVINITTEDLNKDVNSERTIRSLGALVLNDKLNASAQDKCIDMEQKNYWAHTAPDGTEPWVFIKAQITSYRKAGENLAYGLLTSDGVVAGWMNSPAHKDNILDPAFNQVGYGVCDFRGTKLVVQHLAKL